MAVYRIRWRKIPKALTNFALLAGYWHGARASLEHLSETDPHVAGFYGLADVTFRELFVRRL